MVVVGPGTGLGVGHITPFKHRDGTVSYKVWASEGGHTSFTPINDL
jgi:glucokinase